MADGYYLNESDLAKIVKAVERSIGDRYGKGSGGPYQDRDWPGGAPEVYIARPEKCKVIPPREGNCPGTVKCDIFKLEASGASHSGSDSNDCPFKLAPVKLPNKKPKKLRVFNIYDIELPYAYHVIARDKFGKWLVTFTDVLDLSCSSPSSPSSPASPSASPSPSQSPSQSPPSDDAGGSSSSPSSPSSPSPSSEGCPATVCVTGPGGYQEEYIIPGPLDDGIDGYYEQVDGPGYIILYDHAAQWLLVTGEDLVERRGPSKPSCATGGYEGDYAVTAGPCPESASSPGGGGSDSSPSPESASSSPSPSSPASPSPSPSPSGCPSTVCVTGPDYQEEYTLHTGPRPPGVEEVYYDKYTTGVIAKFTGASVWALSIDGDGPYIAGPSVDGCCTGDYEDYTVTEGPCPEEESPSGGDGESASSPSSPSSSPSPSDGGSASPSPSPDSGDSGDGGGSGDSPSPSPSPSGSGGSGASPKQAIVKIYGPDGVEYRGWFCTEEPVPSFRMEITVPLKGRWNATRTRARATVKVPDIFYQCVFADTIQAASAMCTGGPAMVTAAARPGLKTACVAVDVARLPMLAPRPDAAIIQIKGIRCDLGPVPIEGNPKHTEEEYQANRRFWAMAKPPKK